MSGIVEKIWYGETIGPRIARIALTPASWIYALGVSLNRSAAQASAVPALSIGNITVGGTGKTPVAAWAVRELQQRGARPAIVMRGYGADEPLVHRELNPDASVIIDADRVRGAARAREAGADCVVLDDAFQHRRIARVADWVLVAAEQWRDDLHVLPAGPLREPIGELGRASAVVVTRKSASGDEASRVIDRLQTRFPRMPIACCHLQLAEVVDGRTGGRMPLSWLSGHRLVAATGIGAPDAFFGQLRASGAEIHPISFDDHHVFSAADVTRLADAADRTEGLVCTLKDAVKLAPRWPVAAPPLWYVSQSVQVEIGADILGRSFEAVLAARQPAESTAGVAGLSTPLHGH